MLFSDSYCSELVLLRVISVDKSAYTVHPHVNTPDVLKCWKVLVKKPTTFSQKKILINVIVNRGLISKEMTMMIVVKWN